MTVFDDVRLFIEEQAPKATCDDCIAARLKLSVRQHANIKTRALADMGGFDRREGACAICGDTKLVIRIRGDNRLFADSANGGASGPGSFLFGASYLERIAQQFAETQSARLAVAFWGRGAMDQLALADRQHVQIVCNLSTGGTNPREIRELLKAGLKVRQSDRIPPLKAGIDDVFWVAEFLSATSRRG